MILPSFRVYYYALHYALHYALRYALHYALRYALHYALRYALRYALHYAYLRILLVRMIPLVHLVVPNFVPVPFFTKFKLEML
jgi:hypothetical protein